jgi:hypothetical protein
VVSAQKMRESNVSGQKSEVRDQQIRSDPSP